MGRRQLPPPPTAFSREGGRWEAGEGGGVQGFGSWRAGSIFVMLGSEWDTVQTSSPCIRARPVRGKKVLEPTTDFPAWGSGKGTEKPQEILLWRPVRFDSRTYTGLGKQTLGGHKQNLVHQDPGERSSDPTGH